MKTLPGQMLLLFLTLVLLGGSANASQQSQSIGIAEPPEDYRFVISEEGQLISEIRVQIGTSGYLTSIQVQYGNDWSERYGTMEGSLEEVILSADEYIIQVDVSNGNKSASSISPSRLTMAEILPLVKLVQISSLLSPQCKGRH